MFLACSVPHCDFIKMGVEGLEEKSNQHEKWNGLSYTYPSGFDHFLKIRGAGLSACFELHLGQYYNVLVRRSVACFEHLIRSDPLSPNVV